MGNISSLWDLKLMYPTPEEQATIEARIFECVENGYERFLIHRPKDWWTRILKFFMLEHNDLHDAFREKICAFDRDKTLAEATKLMENQIKWNLQNMMDYNPEENWRYELMNRFNTVDDSYLRIWINEVLERGKVKWNKVLIISLKQTPSLYRKYMN